MKTTAIIKEILELFENTIDNQIKCWNEAPAKHESEDYQKYIRTTFLVSEELNGYTPNDINNIYVEFTDILDDRKEVNEIKEEDVIFEEHYISTEMVDRLVCWTCEVQHRISKEELYQIVFDEVMDRLLDERFIKIKNSCDISFLIELFQKDKLLFTILIQYILAETDA